MDDQLRSHLKELQADPPWWAGMFWAVTPTEENGFLRVRAMPLPGESVPPEGDGRWVTALCRLGEECETFGHPNIGHGLRVVPGPEAHLECEIRLSSSPEPKRERPTRVTTPQDELKQAGGVRIFVFPTQRKTPSSLSNPEERRRGLSLMTQSIRLRDSVPVSASRISASLCWWTGTPAR